MCKLWCLVPAAGVGARMGLNVPKQYLQLSSKTVLEQSLEALLSFKPINCVHLILSETDAHWSTLAMSADQRIHRLTGGAERMYSVLNGLKALLPEAGDQDWVLVHDAARPLIYVQDLQALYDAVQTHPVGGLLGLRVTDSIKREAEGHVCESLDRSTLWQAQTPQLFRFGVLYKALRHIEEQGIVATDESQAIESLGEKPLLVESQYPNFKLTHPKDLHILSALMEIRENAGY